MMTNKFIIFFGILFFFSFCKKEKEASPALNNTGTGNTGIVDPNNLYGSLDMQKWWRVTNGVFYAGTSYSPSAFFTNEPFQDEMIQWYSNGIDAGEVLMNGEPLEKAGIAAGDIIYGKDPGANPVLPPFNWVITGSDSVPAFNHMALTTFPTFSSVHSFPDTIHTGQDLTLNLGVLSDYTAIYAQVGGFDVGKVTITTASYYSNKFTISAADLQNNPPNPWQQSIQLWIHKKSYKSVNGKTYKFQNILYFEKDSVVFVP